MELKLVDFLKTRSVKQLLVLGLLVTIIFWALAIALFFFLKYVPVGIRTAQTDNGDGSASRWLNAEEYSTIAVERPHFIVPREISFGDVAPHYNPDYKEKYVPVRFWKYRSDPSFNQNKISFFHFLDESNLEASAAVQGFHINRDAANSSFREDVMAIRTNSKIVDYPTPGFQYSKSPGHTSQFHFIGQNKTNLYYYYPFAKDDSAYNIKHLKNIEGIVQVSLPFVSGDANIVKSDDTENWATTIETLKSLHLHPPSFHSLCADKLQASKDFAQAVFGKSCSPVKHAKVDVPQH